MHKKKEPKWTRAVPLKRPDSIISSDFSNYVPFIADYHKEEISMFKLLAMDYAREWFKEKKKIKDVIVVSNEAAFLQRRYVKRGLLRKLQEASHPEKRFIMKRFQNVPSKFRGTKKEKNSKKIDQLVNADDSKLSSELKPSVAKIDLIQSTPDTGGEEPNENIVTGKASAEDVKSRKSSCAGSAPPEKRAKCNLASDSDPNSVEVCTCECTCTCQSFRDKNESQRLNVEQK